MEQKIVIGPYNKGLVNARTAFNIDNDAFPVLVNAYQWRGRVKRKRGTSLLGRANRFFNSASTIYNTGSTTITLDAAGNGNLIVGFGLETTSNIVPGSVTITGGAVYTDPAQDGTLSPSGSINYATGQITILAEASAAVTASFAYYPKLPILGLEDISLDTSVFSQQLAFDTTYAYQVSTNVPYNIFSVSFYKNPPTSGTYTQKTLVSPTKWNGQDYQQFNGVTYQNAFWVTNSMTEPFNPSNVGMQFKPIVTVTVATPTTATLNINGHGLTIGDFVFVNEVQTTTGINFQTGYVTTVTDVNNVIVTFPNATIATNGAGGIAQYLTRMADSSKDCIRWYDGNPTNSSPTNPVFSSGLGWVNFCPPLSEGNFSIADLPAAKYYLVGAKIITVFKDRLLFIGPVVQTSTGAPVYLQDTIIYSQNGTPYYTASFTGSLTSGATVFNGLLLPTNQTATANSFIGDVTGYGGFLTLGINVQIKSQSFNEDVLILGLGNREGRLIYTGNDIVPFNFFTINSEYGTVGQKAVTNLDRGVIGVGPRGIIITSQTDAARIDMEIPDQVFQFRTQNNGLERVTIQRDFVNEWIYMSYPSNSYNYKFNNQTLQYNYRDQSWAIFTESYTAYGKIRRVDGFTWATIGTKFPTWAQWNEPWNSGTGTPGQPEVIAGTTQGFIMIRDEGTAEGNSISINAFKTFVATITGATNAAQCVLTVNNNFAPGQKITIAGVGGMTQLNGNTYTVVSATPTSATINVNSTLFGVYTAGGTATPTKVVFSPNHMLNNGDFIVISGCLGTIGTKVNNVVFQVNNVNDDGFDIPNTFDVTDTYLGRGVVKRMYVPRILSKQFPVAWGMARKTRLGPQQYLFTTTDQGQVTLEIYLSQNDDFPYNLGPQVPFSNSQNNALVQSSVLFTCPESTNLGLSLYQINLNQPSAVNQQQIWHRVNTGLIGDTVQFGITLSQAQMLDQQQRYQFTEIEFHGAVLTVSPSMMLA